jgi:S-sulfo-L-cysteine synthase (O-acetyl-L-serine-dependent)
MSILAGIGNTPVVELTTMNPNRRVRILCKLEGNNPGGSVKDRPAYYMINEAEKSGQLTHDKVILEPTSGNTGIALAMIGAAKGYKVVLCMPGCVSMERKGILEAYGATVILTPPKEATDGAIRRAHQILSENPDKYYMPNQFSNPNNYLSHYETTGPEIMGQTNGHIDAFVAGMGTTGTLMGLSRYFKEKKPSVRIVGIEPPIGHAIQGLKNMQEAIVPEIYDKNRLDEKMTIDDELAFDTCRSLALTEGIFAGMSSGAAVAGALKLAADMTSGTIVTLICDRGDRYLTTALFRSTCSKCPP